jgi:hypothetical protein
MSDVSFLARGRLVSFGMSSAAQPKYRNTPTVVDGIKFSSKREAKRWQDLCLLERNGELRNIKRQVEYRLEFNGRLICKYRADFVYEELRGVAWSEVVEDVKGFRTREYRIKRKLMEVCHGIMIRET